MTFKKFAGTAGFVSLTLVGCAGANRSPSSTTATTSTTDSTTEAADSNEVAAVDADDPQAPPATLPPDTGKVADLKIVPLKLTMTNVVSDKVIELKADGTLSFDGKDLGKISGHQATLTEKPKTARLRSDGYFEAPQGN